MAMNFPASPTDGETIDGPGGVTWTWDGTKWTFTPSTGGGGGASVAVGDNPPASPSTGDLWFNTEDSQLYIFDTNENQWIVVVNQALLGPQGPSGPPGPNVMPPGVTDGSNATPGQVGEYISLAIATNTTIPSGNTQGWLLNLPVGDWDVTGSINFSSLNTGFNTLILSLVPPLPINSYWSAYVPVPTAMTLPIGAIYPTARVNLTTAGSIQFQATASTVGGGTWGPANMGTVGNAGTIWGRRAR